MKLKQYIHETHNELETALARISPKQPDLFANTIVTDKGVEVDKSTLSRKDELTSSVGAEYIMSIVDYMCTHYHKKVTDAGTLYYEIANIDWQVALDIATGGIKSQRKRAAIAMYHYCATPKSCIIVPPDSGQKYYMQPFTIAMKLVDGNKLTPNQAGKIARLKYKKTVNEETKEKQTFDVTGIIDTVTILFAKPLYSAFFAKRNSTYSLPTGLYAKAWEVGHIVKKDNVNNKECENLKKPLEVMDTEVNISAFVRLVRYTLLHSNFNREDRKNKDFRRILHFDEIDLLKHVYPSFLHREKTGAIKIDRDKYATFLTSAMILWSKIANFPFYATLCIEKSTKGKTTLIFFTNCNKLHKYLQEEGNTLSIDRAAAIRQYKLENPDLTNTTIARHFNCAGRTVYNALHPKSKDGSTDKIDPPKENLPKQ